MVCIVNYNDSLEVVGCTREDGANGGLEFLQACKDLKLEIVYKTQEELDADIAADIISTKWSDLNIFLSALTVTISNDRIIDVSPSSLLNIDNEINAMTDQDISMWHEDWESFEVNKVDLQEARTLRKEAKDVKIVELGIGA